MDLFVDFESQFDKINYVIYTRICAKIFDIVLRILFSFKTLHFAGRLRGGRRSELESIWSQGSIAHSKLAPKIRQIVMENIPNLSKMEVKLASKSRVFLLC